MSAKTLEGNEPGRESRGRVFHLILIKPTHYDDEGYPLQWAKSMIPANTLACLYGAAEDCGRRNVLGDDVEIRIHVIDETNHRVRPARLVGMIEGDGARALVAMVGVQSNQFPRAVDLAQPFLAAGVPVCIGGFHVSGCLAMLPEPTPEIKAAQEMGIGIFAGEAEESRLDEVIHDAWAGKLKPLYNHLKTLPHLPGAPIPFLPEDIVHRTYSSYTSFDLGRGCPFQCSFCTIINVHGRVSRFRDADDLEAIVRRNASISLSRFFVTDDNLARNRNWAACFDRLIELRENEGLKVRIIIQVDALCHRIPGFIEKAVRAGVDQVFIGIETINPETLLATKKKQNRVSEYQDMLLEWKRYPVVTIAGYILGFPTDTKESILRDVDIIKRTLPIDIMYFSYLQPLPGCEDHKRLWERGEWMDPDLNKYDINHRVTRHARMSDEDWNQAYQEAWKSFYQFDHMETVLRRMTALGSNKKLTTLHYLLRCRSYLRLWNCHPLDGGLLRRKYRADRRPGLPRENVAAFYGKLLAHTLFRGALFFLDYARLRFKLRRIWRDPRRFEYRDEAITRVKADHGPCAPPKRKRPDKSSVDPVVGLLSGGYEASAGLRHRRAE